MKIGIVGSRRRDTKEDYDLVEAAFLAEWHILEKRPGIVIVSGGCPKGGDKFAESIAAKYDFPIIIHYPDKSKLDPVKMSRNIRWAYAEINYARNTIIAKDSDVLIACVSSDRKGGTEDTISKFMVFHPEGKLVLV